MPDFWLDYFQRIKADGGLPERRRLRGLLPTRNSLSTTSAPDMGDRDAFGELFAGCREAGHDGDRPHRPARHPRRMPSLPTPNGRRWISNGNPRQHWARPGPVGDLRPGPVQFRVHDRCPPRDHALYHVDGIFSNRWAGHRHVLLRALPHALSSMHWLRSARLTIDPSDPACRAYIAWRQERLFELWRLWEQRSARSTPMRASSPIPGGGALSDLDMKRIGQLADYPLRRPAGAQRAWNRPGPTARTARNTAPPWGASPSAASSAWALRRPYRWKDSVQSGAEIRMWVADGIANGLRPWFTKFCGMLYDPRWLKAVEEIYTATTPAGSLTCATRPRWRGSAMVYSQQTRLLLRRQAGRREGGRPHLGCVPGPDRGAHPLRDGARSAAGRRITCAFKT